MSETELTKSTEFRSFPIENYTPQQFIQDTSVEIDISCKNIYYNIQYTETYFEVKKQYQRYNVGLILLQLNHIKIQDCYKGKYLL